MFGRLLEAAAVFDWITPAWAALQDAAHGPGCTLAIPQDCGWSGLEIERLLRDGGCTTWGLMAPAFSGVVIITVPEAQAPQAIAILERAGVPIEGRAPTSGTHLRHPVQPRPMRGRSRLWTLLGGDR